MHPLLTARKKTGEGNFLKTGEVKAAGFPLRGQKRKKVVAWGSGGSRGLDIEYGTSWSVTGRFVRTTGKGDVKGGS